MRKQLARLANELRYWRGRRALRRHGDGGPGRKIFVVGSGRSGTHWLGRILASHPQIHTEIEAPPVFGWVTAMALDPGRRARLFPRLVARYRAYAALVQPRHFADKSHPNLWLAEALAQALPEACFIAIRRCLEPTVASMLGHAGVQYWIAHWRDYPLPNRFLGIDAGLVERYASLSPAARCALRVIAHSREIDRLRPLLGARLLVLEYEDLLRDPSASVLRLRDFLGLAAAPVPPAALTGAADRWRATLDPQALAEIRAMASELRAERFLAQP